MAERGGGITYTSNSSSKLTNSIIWANTTLWGSQIDLGENSSVEVSYCNLQDGNEGVTATLDSRVIWGLGNVEADPLFVDIDDASCFVRVNSPCIDAGDNLAVPESVVVDLAGNPRIVNDAVDIGAYEYDHGMSRHETASSPSPADGAADVSPVPTLAWAAGGAGQKYDVYLGTDEAAVRDAPVGSPEHQGTRRYGPRSYEAGELEGGTTYYWRVDVTYADAAINKGSVWSFTTRPDEHE
jgi:hypothetical protein